MKKIGLWILLLITMVSNTEATTSKYLYNEANFCLVSPWYLNLIQARNFHNDQYLALIISPQKPLDLWGHLTLDCGPIVRQYEYQEWQESIRESVNREEQFLELLFAPEIDLNLRFLNFRLRDELRLNYNGDLHENLFFGQMRAYPHRLLQGDLSYSTFDAYDLGGIRIEGVSSELRIRIGTVLASGVEGGIQLTSAYYRSKKKIWESEYRPDGGVFLRITSLPFWFEVSWERLKIKEKDLRTKQILPPTSQDRIFVAFGYAQDPKYVRR